MSILDALAEEQRTYEANREQLLVGSHGKYVLIHGSDIIGTYHTEADAISDGYAQFGNVPFFVKRIVPVEEPANFVSPQVKF